MVFPIRDIPGIDADQKDILLAAGIRTTGDLLLNLASAKDRRAFADSTGIPMKNLEDWARRADLMRINGIGPSGSELLQHAGIETLEDLGQEKAVMLAIKLAETNAVRRVARFNPTEPVVEQWITAARNMESRLG